MAQSNQSPHHHAHTCIVFLPIALFKKKKYPIMKKFFKILCLAALFGAATASDDIFDPPVRLW
jgi:hypothetical protein